MKIGINNHLIPVCFYTVILLMTTACDSGSSGEQSAKKQTQEPPVEVPAAGVPIGAGEDEAPAVKVLMSLPDFSLTSQTGATVDNNTMFGRVWVANFIFTECKGSCPVQTEAMKKLQQDMKTSDHWKDIGLVSISVDPETDTPEVLGKYIADHNVNPEQWVFLTGSRDEVWSLSKEGFKLPVAEDRASSSMPIMHSQQFVLVDWEGRVRGYYDSLDVGSVADLKRDMKIVLSERKPFPEGILDSTWLVQRKNAQIEAAKDYGVFHDFGFSDRVSESGISFQHKMVDDVGRDYKAVHYDHGNGLAVADVDSDGLYDIYFTSQAGSNELWRNLGNGRFEDITDKAGLRVSDHIGVAAAFADIDNDGDPDLYITNVRTGNMLFENDGKGHFTDITAESGLGVKAHSSGAVFFDYDKDGLLDMFLSNVGVYTTDEIANVTRYSREKGHEVTDYQYYVGFKDGFAGHLKPERTEKSALFHNMGGNRFEDVSEKTGLIDTSWTGDAITLDGNNDGWTDIYVLNMEGHDEYYENEEGKRFVRKSRDVFPKTPWGAMGGAVFDFDNDGDQDIYVTDMHSDMSEEIGPDKEKLKSDIKFAESFLVSGGNSIFGNAFFRNNGDGTFTEISDSIGAENYWPWGLSSGDLNADGFEDVFITSSMNYPFRYAVNSLLLNDNGKGFLDSEFVLGVEPRQDRIVAPWFELQCSGVDAGRQMCGRGEEGRKVVWGVLGSRASIIFDVDQDGDEDIVTLEFNAPPMVLISNLSEKKELNYLKVGLQGVQSNRDGIGATVKVYSGDQVYTKVNHGKSGYLSQSLHPVYFGLGASARVDKVEISWPSGITQVIAGPIDSNQLLEIKEQ